jgi:hypothetical protein
MSHAMSNHSREPPALRQQQRLVFKLGDLEQSSPG